MHLESQGGFMWGIEGPSGVNERVAARNSSDLRGGSGAHNLKRAVMKSAQRLEETTERDTSCNER